MKLSELIALGNFLINLIRLIVDLIKKKNDIKKRPPLTR